MYGYVLAHSRQLEGHSGAVWSLQQKKELLLTGSHDTTVRAGLVMHDEGGAFLLLSCVCVLCWQAVVWSARHCRYLRTLSGHTGAVFGVDMDDSTQLGFTASGDKVQHITPLILPYLLLLLRQ